MPGVLHGAGPQNLIVRANDSVANKEGKALIMNELDIHLMHCRLGGSTSGQRFLMLSCRP